MYLDGFVDEFDSRHDRIKLHWVDVDMKFWRTDGAGICVRIALLFVYLSNCFIWFIWGGWCFAYDKIVINQWFSIFFVPWTIFFWSIRWVALLCWHLMNNLVETCT